MNLPTHDIPAHLCVLLLCAAPAGCVSRILVDDTGGDSGAQADSGSEGTDPSVDYCLALPHVESAPDVDGSLDYAIPVIVVSPAGWDNTQTPVPDGQEMRYAAAWHEDGLYFFLEVVDPDRNPADESDLIYRGDGVEIFVDHDGEYMAEPPDYDSQGAVHFFVAAPSSDTQPSDRAELRVPPDESYTAWPQTHWAAVPTTNGYNVEAFIGPSSLNLSAWQWDSGQGVGINLAHNISVPPGEQGTDGNLLGQYFLKIREPAQGNLEDYPYINLSVSCSSELLPE